MDFLAGTYHVHMDIKDALHNDIFELIRTEDHVCYLKHINSGLTCSMFSGLLWTDYREIDSDMVDIIKVLYQ